MTEIALPRAAKTIESMLLRAESTWRSWRTRARQRRALETLVRGRDERLLADIGLSRSEIAAATDSYAASNRVDDRTARLMSYMGPSTWWSGGYDAGLDLWLKENAVDERHRI